MPSRIIRSDAQFEALGRTLSALDKPFKIEWRKGEDRSLDQNALMWQWAGDMAAQLGDRTADEVQRQWKLTIGVPILRSENEAFREFYDKALKVLAYEDKLKAMQYVPVTSQMTVPQMTQFIETIQREAAQVGVVLRNKDG